jgi:hypothetical protein
LTKDTQFVWRSAQSQDDSPEMIAAALMRKIVFGSILAACNASIVSAGSLDGEWTGRTGDDAWFQTCGTAYITVLVRDDRIVSGKLEGPKGSGEISANSAIGADGSVEIKIGTRRLDGKLTFSGNNLTGDVQTLCTPPTTRRAVVGTRK